LMATHLPLAKKLANCQPGGRWSALHQMSLGNDLEAVKWLIEECGADPALENRDGDLAEDRPHGWTNRCFFDAMVCDVCAWIFLA